MTEYTIDPTKHERLRKFLAGKGENPKSKPLTVELSDGEASSLLRKAKRDGFENGIKEAKASKAKGDT